MRDDGDPYRSPPSAPQYVCLVCFRSLALQPGECPECGVARLPLSDPEVRDELRAEAERRLQKRFYAEWFWCYLVAFVVTTPAGFISGQLWQRLGLWLGGAMLLGGLHVKAYERLNPRSMLRLYADRRRRLALPPPQSPSLPAASDAPKLLPPHAEDLEDADIRLLLVQLGAHDERER